MSIPSRLNMQCSYGKLILWWIFFKRMKWSQILLWTTISATDFFIVDLNWVGFKTDLVIYLQPFKNCCKEGYRISIYTSNEFKNQEWNFINATISTCSMYCTIIKEWQSWQIMEALEKIKDIIYSYFKMNILEFAVMVY